MALGREAAYIRRPKVLQTMKRGSCEDLSLFVSCRCFFFPGDLSSILKQSVIGIYN